MSLNSQKNYEQALEKVKAEGLKLTKPRQALVRVLLQGHGPFTMDQFQKLMKPVSCDLVTIYRSLAQFEEIGLVRRCDFGDGIARYEFSDEHGHHHHIICRKCHRVDNVEDDCLLDSIDKAVAKRGYSKVTHSLEFFGVCPSCR